MKKTIFIALFLISLAIQSQPNYQRKLFQAPPTGTVTEVVYSNEYNTTSFVIENLKGSSSYSGFASLTKFTTTTGNVTSAKSFSFAGYDLAIKNVIKYNQILYMVASLTNSAVTIGMVMKYNLSTNTSSWRRILSVNSSPYTLSSITFDKDKYLYALGADNVSNSKLFIMKLDTNGSQIWIKELGESILSHQPGNIIYKNKRELYVNSTASYNSIGRSVTLRLDSSATILNTNVLFTATSGGFSEKFSTLLKNNLITVDKTANLPNGDAGPFLVRLLDSNLTSIATKTLNGVNVKQIYSNNSNVLISGLAPVNSGFKGFRTIRLDSLLTIAGARYFKKINTATNLSSSSSFINSSNNSFHFFKSDINDTVIVLKTDFFEGVGCNDTAYVPTSPVLQDTLLGYNFTVTPTSGTLTTITVPIGTLTYSSTSICSSLTTGLPTVLNNEFISVYPNPANAFLTVNSESESISGYTIRDVAGRIIIENTFEKKIDVSYLNNGIYFISLYNTGGQLLYIKKFIKE